MLLLALVGAQDPPSPFTAERFREHVAFLASDELRGRGIGTEGSRQAAEYLIRRMTEFGIVAGGTNGDWRQPFPFETRGQKLTAHNLIGIIPGKGALASQAVIVSTHHDHLGSDASQPAAGKDGIYNGADDNASGCAALLLLAEALHRDRARLPRDQRTVLFVSFDAEEAGLVGSRHYVLKPLWPLERTTANLNFDMVGRLDRQRLYAIDSQSSAFLAERVQSLGSECGLTVETRLAGTRRSDHMNFLDREIPAVHFCTGQHPDYHQVTDEVSKLNHAGGARVAWLAYRLLLETMTIPGPIRYRMPDPSFDLEAAVRLVTRLGVIPAVNAQSGRYPRINYVIPGSAASRQGLRGGDEIAAIDGKRFERAEDAAVLFGQLSFDRDLKLSVLRDGKTVEVTFPADLFQDLRGPVARPIGPGRYEVIFRYRNMPRPQSVHLAGTFNNWEFRRHPMTGPDKDGWYSLRLELPAGDYQYTFVVNEKEWQPDPNNIYRVGRFANSLLRVGQ